MKNFKIIVDSSSDLKSNYLNHDDIDFSVIPLSINIGDKIFLDDDDVDSNEVLDVMNSYDGKSTTSCPAPGVYLKELSGAKNYFIITISSKLSGSFNSACIAKEMCDNKNVHVIDSKLVSGAMILLVDELVRLIDCNLEFDEIVKTIENYNSERHLMFTLCKYDNLVKAGRMSRVMSVIASTLRIVPVCEGIDGEIHIREKTITQKSAYRKIAEAIKSKFDDLKHKICIISHCQNVDGANYMKSLLLEKCNFKEIRIIPVKALCAFYALKGGIIISY